MKGTLLISAFVIGSITTFATALSVEKKLENADCQYGQCMKYKQDGYRCRNCAQQYSSYCWSHSK